MDYGTPAVEVLDADLEPTMGEDDLERLRVLAGTPRWGREIDDRILPAEAGLDETAISFTRAATRVRSRSRGSPSRARKPWTTTSRDRWRRLPPYDAELIHDGKAVGRVTSAVRDNGRVAALAYVRARFPRTPCSRARCARHDSNVRPLPPQGTPMVPSEVK